MDAHVLDGGDLADGTGQLSLQGVLIVQALDETGRVEIRPIEKFKADPTTLRKPFAGQMQAPVRDLLSRHRDGTATRQNAIGDAVIYEFIHDRGGIFRRQVGEERAKLRLTRPQEEGGKARQRREDAANQHPFCTVDSLAKKASSCATNSCITASFTAHRP
jgi:hypothetical protein